jgi:5-methylcytosine-specific restriction endonuclease McrA
MTRRKGYRRNRMNPLKKRNTKSTLETIDKTQNKTKLEPYTEDYVAKSKEFYASQQWRFLRYEVFLRDGRICVLCGATPEDGTRLHVDHIIPLRQDWGLRLKIDNLQVLCEECNHGKGSRDSTDWRPKRGSPSSY